MFPGAEGYGRLILPEDSAWNVNIVSISLPASEMFGRNGFYSFYNNLDENGSRPRGMAVMEVFDPRGSRVGHSNVELAVSGFGSSAGARRSLRIYYKGANNLEGGMESDLNYDLFGGLAKDRNGQAITSFSRLLLRNSGQDSYLSGFRDAYMQRVAAGLCADTIAVCTDVSMYKVSPLRFRRAVLHIARRVPL